MLTKDGFTRLVDVDEVAMPRTISASSTFTTGFTLIEIIIVMAIIGFIIAFGTIVDLNVLRGDTFHTEEATIVAILEKARSRSMANMFESAHGVCYIAPDYVIFKEADGHCVSGVGSNEIISANTTIATASNFSATFPVIVFNQHSGNKIGPIINLNITDGIKSAVIEINDEGRINW